MRTLRLPVTLLAGAVAIAVGVLAAQSQGARSLSDVERAAADARAREQVLTTDVSRLTAKIRAVETRLAPVQARWETLNRELTALRTRRIALTDRLESETRRLKKLIAMLAQRRAALSRRLSASYRSGDPSMLQLLLQSGSLSDVVAARENIARVATQDKTLITSTRDNANESRRVRVGILDMRREVYANEQRVGVAEAEAAQALAVIATERNNLVAARGARTALLSQVQGDRRQLEAEARGLRARSLRLAAQIQSSSASLPPTVAVSGTGQFGWPVNGTLTSSFGPRWGRMHEGIDIAAPTGTPIAAAAAGTVILAGWSGGYGNLVVISHGSIATAYAHQSRIVVSVGQQVSRGTVIGAVGSTGNSTGPHLHFEVRVNGSPQNPLAYL